MSLLKDNGITKRLLAGSMALIMCTALVGCGSASDSPQDIKPDANIQANPIDDLELDVTHNDGPMTEEEIEELLNSVEGYTSETSKEMNAVTEFTCGKEHLYVNQYLRWQITGLEEFESLHSDYYDDIPQDENKIFLVFYMDMTNNDGSEIYISPDYCEFDVDGVITPTTFLVNEPIEGYETAFGYLHQTGNGFYYDKKGFMVLEVPRDWQNIKFTYTGLRYDDLGNNIVINNFTRDDIHRPE